jgi:uncharacterized membrane protein (UPF0136 family)
MRMVVVLTCLVAAAAGLQLGHFRSRLTSPGIRTLLPTTFSFWDRAPASRHLGLAFVEPQDPERGRAYQHFSPVWLTLLYLLLKPFGLMGVPYASAQNALVFGTFLVMVWMIAAALTLPDRAGADGAVPDLFRPGAGVWGIPLMLLALCTLATLPSLWVASLIANPEENNRYIAAIVVAFISALDFHGRPFGRAGFMAALTVALLAPMCAPFLLVVLLVLAVPVDSPRLPSGVRWESWRTQGPVLLAVAACGVVVPYLTARAGGWIGVGSSPLFRSGLDGDTQYFSTMMQAVFRPFDVAGRHWALLPIPVAALAVSAGAFVISRPLAERMLRQLFVAWSPALFWIVLFPQIVSIHPYVFDFGLMFPPAFCLAFWFAQKETHDLLAERRGLVLALGIMLIGLLMTNGLDLARVRKWPPLRATTLSFRLLPLHQDEPRNAPVTSPSLTAAAGWLRFTEVAQAEPLFEQQRHVAAERPVPVLYPDAAPRHPFGPVGQIVIDTEARFGVVRPSAADGGGVEAVEIGD